MKLETTEHGTRYCPDDPAEPKRLGITEEEERILAEAASHYDRILEIGTGLGLSTRALAMCGRGGVITVDPDPWVRQNVKLPENAEQLAELPPEMPIFDLAFVDGDHGLEAVKRDIAYCLRNVTGPIFVHDYELPEVRRACDELALAPAKTWGEKPCLARFR